MYDLHWITAAARLGDSCNVIAQKDVRAESGQRLVARGRRVDSTFVEPLAGHKLLAPLETCLRVEDGVRASHLRRDAAALRTELPLLGELLDVVATELAPIEIFNQIPLNDALSFMLTVAREQRPRLYRHGILVALLALVLAMRAKWNRPQVLQAVTAGLFHDLGELHLDPEPLEPGRILCDQERRALHTHPVLGYVTLKEFPEYNGPVSRGVLEHHERVDGSGYPHGLTGEQIGVDGSGYPSGLHGHQTSPLGRLLAVAEVVASRIRETATAEERHRLLTLLKLNLANLDADFVSLIFPLLQRGPAAAVAPHAGPEQLRGPLGLLGSLLTEWEKATAGQVGSTGDLPEPLFEFVTHQVLGLRTRLYDAGFNPREPFAMLTEIEDGDYLHEVDGLVREALWQMAWLAGEVARRWPAAVGGRSPLLNWLQHAREAGVVTPSAAPASAPLEGGAQLKASSESS